MILIDSSDSATTDCSTEIGHEKSDQSLMFTEGDRVQGVRRTSTAYHPSLSNFSQNGSKEFTRGAKAIKKNEKRRLKLLRNTKPIEFDDEENALYLSSSKSYNTITSEEEKMKSESGSIISSHYKRERLKSLEACKEYLNEGRLFNKNVSENEKDNFSLPSTVNFVIKNKNKTVSTFKPDIPTRKLVNSKKENQFTGTQDSRNGISRSFLSELADKESLNETMLFDSVTAHHIKQGEEEPNYTEFSMKKSIEKNFNRPLYVSMQENANKEEMPQFLTDTTRKIPSQIEPQRRNKSSIETSCVVPREVLAWEKENSVINVQITSNSFKEEKNRKGFIPSNSSVDTKLNFKEMSGFAIRTRDLIAREKEIQKLIKEEDYHQLSQQGQTSSESNLFHTASLLLRKLQMLKNREKSFGKGCKADLNDSRSRTDTRLTDSKHSKVENVYSIILNPISEISSYLVKCKKFYWSPYLNECIRTYYNTGLIRVPEQCTGYDILLALDYFGIVYATHQLSFASFGCYIRLKSWRNYFNHRPQMANFIVRQLLASKSRFSHTFFTSSIPTRKTIYFGNDDCELFEGGLIPDPQNDDHIPHSCAVVNRYFNGYESSSTNSPENRSDETSELMRHDFSSFLQNLLPGTLVTFSIKQISPQPLLSSDHLRAHAAEKRNTYTVLSIVFDQTKSLKTSSKVIDEKIEKRNFSTDIKNNIKENESICFSRSNKDQSSKNKLNSGQTSDTIIEKKLVPSLRQLEIEARIYKICESTSISSGSVEAEFFNDRHPRSLFITPSYKDRKPMQSYYHKNLNSKVMANQRQHAIQSSTQSLSCAQLNKSADKLSLPTLRDKSKHKNQQEKSNRNEARAKHLDEVNASWLRDVIYTEKNQCVAVCSHYCDSAVDETNKQFLFFNPGNHEAGQ